MKIYVASFMQRLALFACLFVCVSTAAVAQTYEAGVHKAAEALDSAIEAAGQKSVSVLDLTDLQGATTELGRFLAQELSDQLVAVSRKVAVVDRASMQHLLQEKSLSAEGFVNPESSKKIGNLIGIDTVILGSITPLGQQTIRMSLRAIALETGKVVASQSVSLPVTGDLSALYNRGVSSASPSPSLTGPAAAMPDDLSRFRGDSLKFKGKEVSVYECYGNTTCMVSAQFSLENLSGVGFGAAIRAGSTSIGPCVENEHSSSGLPVIQQRQLDQLSKQVNPERALGRYFPNGARLDGVVTYYGSFCGASALRGIRSADLSITVVVATASGIIGIPLSSANVPVRSAGQP